MNKSPVCLLSLLIFFFLFLGGVAAFAQFSFTVVPPLMELSVPAGSTRELSLGVFTAAAEEKKEMRFRLYAADFNLRRDGTIQFFRPGTLRRSAAGWIEIDPLELVMKPEESKQVKVKLSIPGDASGGYYAAVMVELVPHISPEAVIGVVQRWRMVSIVELTVAGWKRARAKINISELKVQPSPEGKGLTFTTAIENKGNLHVRGEGNLVITTRAGRRLAELSLKAGRGTILPNSVRDFRAVLEKELPPGEYLANATFQYRNKRVRAKISFPVGTAPTEAVEVAKKKEVNFSVGPPVVEINAPPGSIRTINLRVANEDEQPLHFRLYLKDIRIESDGETTVLEKGSTSWSCSNWIELRESEFELRPMQRKSILGMLKIPEDVAGGRYARLVVEGSLVGAKTGEKVTTIIPETTFMITVGDKLEKKAEVSEFQLLQANGSSPQFLVVFKNTGNRHLVVRGGITLKNWIGETVAELLFSEGEAVVLPGGVRNFTASPAQPLEAGQYKAKAVFLSENKELVTATKEITVAE